MTRLTPEMIRDVPSSSQGRDSSLARALGMTMKELAYTSVGIDLHELDMEGLTAACVPVTAGLGATAGFSESVCAIVEHLGPKAYVTEETDVAGLGEAPGSGADLIFMADDNEFLAINCRARRAVNNIRSTALGYFTALREAAGGLRGRDVLLIGAGRVGSCSAELLARNGAKVTVVDVDRSKAEALRSKFREFTVCDDLMEAVKGHDLILNASPARIPGEWVQQGCVVSSPGMPFSFDEIGIRKMATLVHDPLQIGVSVMAVWSASLSLPRAPLLEGRAVWMEAI